jgi:hypothetical protein
VRHPTANQIARSVVASRLIEYCLCQAKTSILQIGNRLPHECCR